MNVLKLDDRAAMQQALACAHSVEGRTSPRPAVGAVVMRNGELVGRGATAPPYGPHAEVHALQDAGERARGADLYVTLEPCCVTIHTPPCTRAIIEAGIRRVVVATLDPNPLVFEHGVEHLRRAGIEVIVGVEEQEAREILRPFATFITKGRPYVTAKWAMTLDGKIATRTGDAFWISGPKARTWVHNLRDRVDAIMVGAGTARTDDPQLTVRLSEAERDYQRAVRKGPLRVVVSSRGELSPSLQLFQEGATGTYVMLGEHAPQDIAQRLLDLGVEVVRLPLGEGGQIDMGEALAMLARKGIMHVLLEGGAGLLGSAFERSLLDHICVFVAPKLVGGAQAPGPLGGIGLARMQEARQLSDVRSRSIGDDLLIEGELATN